MISLGNVFSGLFNEDKIFHKKGLTNIKRSDIIIKLTTSAEYMRQCWNWQTGTFEGRVFNDVRVQVPFAA